jgi:protein-tyrosine phosphatase
VADPTPDRFKVLFVCTANVCRSPMAELLLRHALLQSREAGAGRWALASAGTRAPVGRAIDERARKVLAERGVDVGRGAARQLLSSHVSAANLVLTAAREHRSEVVRLQPDALRRTFTIRQFARLCAAAHASGLVAARGEDLPELAVAARTLVQPVQPSEEDVADPISGHVDDFRRTADLFEACIADILGTLVPR